MYSPPIHTVHVARREGLNCEEGGAKLRGGLSGKSSNSEENDHLKAEHTCRFKEMG